MWKKVIFSNESKFNLIKLDGIRYVQRPDGKILDPKYTILTVKYGGGFVIIWACFLRFEMGPFHRVQGNMDRCM